MNRKTRKTSGQTPRRQEKKHLLKLKNGAIKQTDRLELFLNEFLMNGGNATEAAWKTFNCKNRASAAVLGGYYLKKAKDLNRFYLEEKGFTTGRLLENIAQRAIDPTYKTPEWMDRALKLMGIEDFMNKPIVKIDQTIKIDQHEKEILNKYIDGEIEEMNPVGLEESEKSEAEKEKA